MKYAGLGKFFHVAGQDVLFFLYLLLCLVLITALLISAWKAYKAKQDYAGPLIGAVSIPLSLAMLVLIGTIWPNANISGFAGILLSATLSTFGVWLYLALRPKSNAKELLWWQDSFGGFFPVILFVFVLRSFIVEPFKIPSGSMIPTLLVGDFIVVNKYTYGIRLPVINKKIIDLNSPQRGDVMVFRYPEDPSLDYIKRVVGIPGDKVAYQNKRLTINGKTLETKALEDYLHPNRLYFSKQYSESLGETPHRYLNDDDVPPFINDAVLFPHRENCLYNNAGVICTVPPGHYFMMGDNRDNSKDSRVWGFVPEENIVGKAYFIWMHFESLIPPKGLDFSRIGSFK